MASDEELERTRHMVQRQPGSRETDAGMTAQESTLPLRAGAAMPAVPLPEPAFVVPADAEITTFSLPPVHTPEAVTEVAAPARAPVAPIAPGARPAPGFSRWYAVSLGLLALGLILYVLARFLPS